jgi:carboxyl-terminal processing protease
MVLSGIHDFNELEYGFPLRVTAGMTICKSIRVGEVSVKGLPAMNAKIYKIVLILITICLFTGGIAIGYRHWPLMLTSEEKSYISLFKEVIAVLTEKYVDEVDRKKLLEGSVKGMLAALDPHSAYLPPEPFKEMKVEMSGSFGGIGTEIGIRNDKLTVIAPIEDTPAFRAGIKANDHIEKIDAISTKAMGITDAVKLMRGPKGTKVTLTIRREGSPGSLVFTLVRDIILTKSVKFRTLEPGYGYVKISHFKERTGVEFSTALQSLHEQNGGSLKGLVLDLRNNPGGLLDQAVMVANRFIGENLSDGLIVYTLGRSHSARNEINATIGSKEPHYPFVVLINGASASASEIVAGALQDHNRAIIIGTQSFGKGSIQSIMPLAGGAGLKLTTARYYTPSGRSIQARGITPDIQVTQVNLSSTGKEKGLEIHEKDLEKHLPNSEESAGKRRENPKQPVMGASPGEETAKDYQLVRALEMVRGLDVMRKIAHTQN